MNNRLFNIPQRRRENFNGRGINIIKSSWPRSNFVMPNPLPTSTMVALLGAFPNLHIPDLPGSLNFPIFSRSSM